MRTIRATIPRRGKMNQGKEFANTLIISVRQDIPKPNKTTMIKLIVNIFLPLLLLAAACGGLAWLLPVKVSVTLLFLLQVLMLIIIGNILKQENDDKES